MARISTYPKDTNISLTDKLLGSDADNSLSTKQFEITDVVSFLRTQNIGSQGPQGPQGVQGNTGAAGAVGPAGLNWQSAWVSGTSYVADDAVGYGGASWFCILATSGTTTPDLDTTHWALLASQGANGPAGVAGPTGAQGPSGTTTYTEESKNTNSLSVAGNPATPTSKITKNFTRAYVTSAIDNFLGLSNIGKVTGDFFVVQNKSTTLDLVIVPIDYARFLQPSGFASQVNFTLGPNRYARFTLTDTTSGSDKVFMVEVINPLGETGGTQVAKIVKRTLTHSELLNIFTTPIIILPATVGKMYVPKDVLIKYINNDGWSSTGNWKVLLDTLQLTGIISQMGGGTVEEQFTYLLQGNPSNTNTSFFNKDVFITATANPTVPVNGTTTADIYITYFEITL